jgi:hypothetical protein
MADRSAIEWTEATWNPVTGCSKVSPGCAHCYAETFAERFRGVRDHPYEQGFDLRLWPGRLEQPLRWRRPRMIFVNSMSDLFHEEIPEEFIRPLAAASPGGKIARIAARQNGHELAMISGGTGSAGDARKRRCGTESSSARWQRNRRRSERPRGVRKRVQHATRDDLRPHRMPPVLERCHDAEVPRRRAARQELGALVGARSHAVAVGGRKVGGEEVVACGPVRARDPSESATERQTWWTAAARLAGGTLTKPLVVRTSAWPASSAMTSRSAPESASRVAEGVSEARTQLAARDHTS